MKNELQLAYLAGILDGEGYFGIRKHKGDGKVNPRYQEEVKVSMVEVAPIRMLRDLFGGNVSKQKGTNRPLHRYEASDKVAGVLCATLLPYLIVKRRNARIILSMRRHKEKTTLKNMGKRGSAKNVSFRENCYVRCKQNNSPKHLYENNR